MCSRSCFLSFDIPYRFVNKIKRTDIKQTLICKTKAEWIDDQASQDENFDAFAQSTFDGLDLFRQTAMAAIAEYKAETGAADVD